MKILFITDNFPPETNAPASRTFEHVTEWVKKGADVTVVTCAPNFPSGKVFSGYSNAWYKKDTQIGFDVIRVKTFIAPNTGIFKRMLDFLSFMIMSAVVSIFLKRNDVVVATSPQFFSALSGWFIAKVKRSKFVFEVRDIWPSSIKAVGYTKYNRIFAFFEKLELFLYRQANSIVVVTEAFKTELVERGIDPGKIDVVLNGVDTKKFYQSQELGNCFRREFRLEEKLIIGYVGTLGMSHSLDTIIELSENFLGNDNIHFIFVNLH